MYITIVIVEKNLKYIRHSICLCALSRKQHRIGIRHVGPPWARAKHLKVRLSSERLLKPTGRSRMASTCGGGGARRSRGFSFRHSLSPPNAVVLGSLLPRSTTRTTFSFVERWWEQSTEGTIYSFYLFLSRRSHKPPTFSSNRFSAYSRSLSLSLSQHVATTVTRTRAPTNARTPSATARATGKQAVWTEIKPVASKYRRT